MQFRQGMAYVCITFVVLLFLNIYCSQTSQQLFIQSKEESMIEKCQLASDEIITFRQNNDYKLLAEKVWGIFQMQLQTPEAGVRQILVPSALADVETLEEKIREKMSTLSQRQHYQEKRK